MTGTGPAGRAADPGGRPGHTGDRTAHTGGRPGHTGDRTAHTGGVPGDAGADLRWLAGAIELSGQCPPAPTAFSVGAILVAADGRVIATGFSRERDPHDHAEEVALARAAHPGGHPAPAAHRGASWPASADSGLADATLYSSLEPCAARASRPRTCAELIISAGVRRVVIAWLEPPVFVAGGGAARLRAAGVRVIEIPCLAHAARAVNAHLLEDPPLA